METNGHAAASPPRRQLMDRLDDPKTVDALNRLLDRLDLLAFTVEAGAGLLQRGEEISENLHDAYQEAKSASDSQGVDPVSIFGALPQMAAAAVKFTEIASSPAVDRLLKSGLLERLADPRNIDSIQTLLDHLPLLAFSLTAVDGLLQRGELLTDNFADAILELKRIGDAMEPYKFREALAGLPKVIDAGLALINAGLFDPEVVRVLVEVGKQAANPYTEAKHLPDNLITPWKMYQSLRDPDVQRAVGVGLHIVKRYGQTFNRSEVSPPPLSATTTAPSTTPKK